MRTVFRIETILKAHPLWHDLAAWIGLAAATLAVCWPLGLTNRILAGVDAFTYFLPYWAYRSAELRAGHLPLWNPYLFLGVPFLANPQAAVLYPLHWPLLWLEPARALIWSALLHIWLAAGFMYAFARRSLRVRRPAAWTAALLFGLGGFTLGKIENINQLNALAWLPATLWCFDEARAAIGRWPRIRWAAALSVVLACQILAGHTQTTFINLVGLGTYALIGLWGRREPIGRRLISLWPLAALGPAVLLAAAQLLPTLELNGLGLRTGGLTYRLAVSFSLRPRLLLQTFLPPFGGGLAEAFGSEGFTEFTGYIGVAGLMLAVIALVARSAARLGEPPRAGTAGLALLGVFLALGAYNPVYYLLWRFVPGFDLFRAPARWLALYAFGMAALAGMGLDVWLRNGGPAGADAGTARAASWLRWPMAVLKVTAETQRTQRKSKKDSASSASLRCDFHSTWRRRATWGSVLILLLLAATQQLPALVTILGWAAAAILALILLLAGRRRPIIAAVGLPCLILAELWLAGRSLPFTLATAPAALSLRNAPAALLAATGDLPPAGRDRFLSMSDIRYDPGDLAELRALQADRLPAEAVERLVRAAKWNEVLAPNLALMWQLPALDGYDGGVLPTADYNRLLSLFIPAESRLPDGRLREQLRAIPPDRLLDLVGVRFVITDKQHDLWSDDVYYDLEQPVALRPGQELTLNLDTYPAFSATAIGVVAAPAADGPASARGIVGVVAADGRRAELALAVSDASDPPRPIILPLPQALVPATLTLAAADGSSAGLIVRGLSLLDTRTAAHQSVTLSPRGDLRRIHSGDVKIYERSAAPGRAWLVHGVIAERDPAVTLAGLAAPNFDPRAAAYVAADLPPVLKITAETQRTQRKSEKLCALCASAVQSSFALVRRTPHIASALPMPAGPGETVRVVSWEAERVHLEADVRAPALLVLADSFYPGWVATVDGAATPILRTNLMLRGVLLSPGHHTIIFSYEPQSWRVGSAISLATCLALALIFVGRCLPRANARR